MKPEMKLEAEKTRTDSGKVTKPGREFRLYFVLAVIIFVAAFLVSRFFFQLMLIQGGSMEPTYHNMQLVLLEKNYGELAAGDVIAFGCEDLDSVLVKRVVALPGQSVVIRDGTLYVDGMESPLYDRGAFEYAGLLEMEARIAGGNYAVIGDNVIESKDSRYEEVGFVDEGSVLGRVVGRGRKAVRK